MSLAAACALVASGAAEAEDAAWRHSSALQARSNRPGFGLLSFTGYRQRLYAGTEHLLLRGAYLEAGLVTQLSPASFHPGAYVEAVPIAPLLLRLTAQRLMYFGTFGPVSTTPSPDSAWSGAVLDDFQRDGGRPGSGTLAEAMVVVRLKVGPVVGLLENRLGYYDAAVPTGVGWYEPVTDLLLAEKDLLHTTKGTLGYLVHGALNGDRFLVVGGHWERYAARESESVRHIAGAVALWRALDCSGAPVTFAALAGVMAFDRYRTGDPYIGLVAQVDVGGPDP